MGRGRAKAKQTKVARELKYSSPQTDFGQLQRELSHAPDEHPAELQAAYEDRRIAVPGTVFNAVLNRPDPIH